jgi:Glycosyltransferase sugar-binding region containing DXD motif
VTHAADRRTIRIQSIVDRARQTLAPVWPISRRGRTASGQPYPVFAYWHDDNISVLDELVVAWSAQFSEFRILGDADIIPLIRRYYPDYADIYKAIGIPAARADVARLLAIYEFGGLYIDCHCGIVQPDALKVLLGELDRWEAVFVDRTTSDLPRPLDEHHLINSMIFARPRCALFLAIARQAFANLAWQRAMEQRYGLIAYRIERVTGPLLLTSMVLQPGSCNRDIRADFADRVRIIPEDDVPVKRNCYRGYGRAGTHWSLRQRSESLFVPTSPPFDMTSPEARLHNLYEAEYRSAVEGFEKAIPQLRRLPASAPDQT